MKQSRLNFHRDLLVIFVSALVALFLLKNGVLQTVLSASGEWRIFGSILAGMFFVSIFTVVPASAVLLHIAATSPIWEVAFFGAIGSLIGDLIIFRFIKDNLSEDIRYVISRTGLGKFFSIFKRKIFLWFLPFVGALVVASPLPDEIGLAMMGFSKMRMAVFIPVSFILNFLGILVIALSVRGLLGAV